MTGGKGFDFLIDPFFSSATRSAAIRFNNVRCRFVVWVLWDELAADGEVEDGLAEGFDLVGAGGERGEVVEGEGGVILKCRRVGVGRVEAGEARCRHPVARRLSFHSRRLQAVAECHEFIDLGDDTVLFGEGWEGKQALPRRLLFLGAASLFLAQVV